jgi:hypothetical protein
MPVPVRALAEEQSGESSPSRLRCRVPIDTPAAPLFNLNHIVFGVILCVPRHMSRFLV